MAGWSVLLAADDGTKYGTMIHREYFTLIRVLRPMAQLYFYYSAMNAGKSTALLQSSYNYQERGCVPLFIPPKSTIALGQGR